MGAARCRTAEQLEYLLDMLEQLATMARTAGEPELALMLQAAAALRRTRRKQSTWDGRHEAAAI